LRSWILALAAVGAAVAVSAGAAGAPAPTDETEVVVTLKAPPLAAFGSAHGHRTYAMQLRAAQAALADRIVASVPGSRIRWRYTHVANGLAVVLPHSSFAALANTPGVARVWPNVRYHALRLAGTPQQIGADKLWGPGLETAGNGMKIGVIDEGLDATHPFFDPAGYSYPPGFPKGRTDLTTPKVIVERAFPPPKSSYKYANDPIDPTESFHGTHVGGIAAGNPTTVRAQPLSGVAPRAYLGNYKALTTPTPGFGLDGNSAEIAAAIEAAVADGMDVINLSIGEPEVEPTRDLVVKAIDGAAAAGVVPVVATGNDFDVFGYGSVSSPGNAAGAISVAAVNSAGTVADFSSAGPTPVSLRFKPDVSAPGVNVLSSLEHGTFGTLSGTSMAAPAVAGAAALLKQRHPTWTVPQIKSALVQTGDPAHENGAEAPATREGGGVIDLPRADAPLVFAVPTALSFGVLEPGTSRTKTVALTDAGGGAGDWSVSVVTQTGGGRIDTAAAVTVPGSLVVGAVSGSTPGDVTGFVVLTRGTDVRRIPFWFDVASGQTAAGPFLRKPATVKGTTKGAPSRIASYRYPTSGDGVWRGPERAYRIRITGRPANVGAVTLSGTALPHVLIGNSADRLAGYAGLPTDLNPYRKAYGGTVPVAGAVLPAPGVYTLVFDTRSAAQAGPFTFRWWVNDVTPPRLRLVSVRGGIAVAASDAGSGVDPSSVSVSLDGRPAGVTFASGEFHIRAAKGAHTLLLTAADYQETKNMEDVPKILPNTATLRARVTVR
jgi:subtilisin family serine protease